MPDLTIVIVNYNTCTPLRACLESILREQGDLQVETLVVDNGSVDGSTDMIREYAPAVRLIDPGINTWFAGGNNLGVREATGDYVLLLNPDTLVQPGMLQTMLAYLRQNPGVGAITCRMTYPDGRLQRTCSRKPTYRDLLLGYTFLGALFSGWRNRRRARMWYADWERDSEKSVEVLPGSCIMAPRSVLNAVQTFSEDFKLYFVEDDMCPRIRALGYDVRFVPDALVLHEEHASVKQVQRLASRVYFDDLLVFCRKHYGAWRMGLLRALMWPTRRAMDVAQRLRGEQRDLKKATTDV